MRKFSSYGPIDTDLHYYVPRKDLIAQAYTHLLGENSAKGGHYVTVWAPRQSGKTWLMQQILFGLQEDKQYEQFAVAKINLQYLKMQNDVNIVVQSIAEEISKKLNLAKVEINRLDEFHHLFTKEVLKKPLILILDEFDALTEESISGLVGLFRNIYISRQDQMNKPTAEKDYLLHGIALVGIMAVLGIENVSGSPFNIQRSLHVPNLTFGEVESMFKWYERESGQKIEQEVIDRLFYETQGQPGLTCWLGELLTETYNQEKNRPIAMANFEEVYANAVNVLPNNNILNIISKAKQETYKPFILEMFKTDKKIEFKYNDSVMNFLYLNGVIDWQKSDRIKNYVKFPCPFVQKRLFDYFSNELFRGMGNLYSPFDNLEDTITENSLNIKNLLKRYQSYLQKNRDWLFKNAPRRTTDLRIYEAVYHFNLYMYLSLFLESKKGEIYLEFPTGNGQIDLIIKYVGQVYGIEVKSFTDALGYKDALKQAARYGKQLKLSEIILAFFVEYVDEANRQKYEVTYLDKETGVMVIPIFVETGN